MATTFCITICRSRFASEDLYNELVAHAIVTLGIWFPREAYQRMPVMLPWAVRDPNARGNKRKGLPDQWGAPNSAGFFRDDNSMLKGLPRSLLIRSSTVVEYRNARLGKGFIAAHVWRIRADGELASRVASTYSFVPNVLWLPQQVAKLTDREGEFPQRFIQALALKIFRNVPLSSSLKPFAERAWHQLPDPRVDDALLPAIGDLNYFTCDDKFLDKQALRTEVVLRAISAINTGGELGGKVISTRFGDGLPGVDPRALNHISADLTAYHAAVEAAESI